MTIAGNTLCESCNVAVMTEATDFTTFHNDSGVVQKFIVHISKPFGCFWHMRSAFSSSHCSATASTLDLVDGLCKTLDVGGCDTSDGDSAVLGGVD